MDRERWGRIQDLFHHASELAAIEREAFLRGECRDDDELYGEVVSLLDAETRIEERVAGVVGEVYAASLEEYPEPRERIGPYKIVGRLGEGGMSTVFLGERDDDLYQMRVAIKLIKRGMETDEIQLRFRQERHILAGLDHPHICKLLDGGNTEDGLPYFVMEAIEGEPVDGYCERHELTLKERLRLFIKICSAVQYAHRNLVIHRDLKPSNLLVTTEGVPKLLDFGIAKLLDAEKVLHSLAMTGTGLRLLTPEYGSPEQVRGEPLATSTDVYSLGLVLFLVLTGRTAYHFESRRPTEIERVVCSVEPQRPSQAVLQDTGEPERARRLSRQLRGDLDNIVLKALRKESRERYASVEQFATDIERYLAGLPIRARPATWTYRAGKFAQRNRVLVIAASLIFLSLVGGIVTTSWQAQIALRHLREAEAHKRQADESLDLLVESVDVADPEESLGKDMTVRQMVDHMARRLDQGVDFDPAARATTLAAIGRLKYKLGEYDSSEALLQEAVEIRRNLPESNRIILADTLNHLGELYMDIDQPDAAWDCFQEALQIQRQRFGDRHPELSGVLANFGTWHFNADEYEKAEHRYQESLEMSQGSGPNKVVLVTRFSLATTYQVQGRLAEAESLREKTLSEARAVLGDIHPYVIQAQANQVGLLFDQRRWTEAEPIARRVLAAERKLRLPGHRAIANRANTLAAVLFELDQWDEAETLFLEALSIHQALGGPDSKLMISSHNNLGNLYLYSGRFLKGEEHHREALRLRRIHLHEKAPHILQSQVRVAEALLRQRRFSEARTMIEGVRPAIDASDKHILRAQAYLVLGWIGLFENRPIDADAVLRELDLPGLAGWSRVTVEVTLALCLLQMNKNAEARSVLQDTVGSVEGRPFREQGVRTRKFFEQLIALAGELGEGDFKESLQPLFNG